MVCSSQSSQFQTPLRRCRSPLIIPREAHECPSSRPKRSQQFETKEAESKLHHIRERYHGRGVVVVHLRKMYTADPKQMVDQHPAMMVRCLMIRCGIVAIRENNICTTTKATAKTLMTVRRAITRPLLHYNKLARSIARVTRYWIALTA